MSNFPNHEYNWFKDSTARRYMETIMENEHHENPRPSKFKALIEKTNGERFWSHYEMHKDIPLIGTWRFVVRDLQYLGLSAKGNIELYEGDVCEYRRIVCDMQDTGVPEWSDGFCAGHYLKKERFVAKMDWDFENPLFHIFFEYDLPSCFDPVEGEEVEPEDEGVFYLGSIYEYTTLMDGDKDYGK